MDGSKTPLKLTTEGQFEKGVGGKRLCHWWLQIFLHVHPYFREMIRFWRAYFSNGLVQPPTRKWLWFLFLFWMAQTWQVANSFRFREFKIPKIAMFEWKSIFSLGHFQPEMFGVFAGRNLWDFVCVILFSKLEAPSFLQIAWFYEENELFQSLIFAHSFVWCVWWSLIAAIVIQIGSLEVIGSTWFYHPETWGRCVHFRWLYDFAIGWAQKNLT